MTSTGSTQAFLCIFRLPFVRGDRGLAGPTLTNDLSSAVLSAPFSTNRFRFPFNPPPVLISTCSRFETRSGRHIITFCITTSTCVLSLGFFSTCRHPARPHTISSCRTRYLRRLLRPLITPVSDLRPRITPFPFVGRAVALWFSNVALSRLKLYHIPSAHTRLRL
jgi:hypothetical protein